MNETNNNGKIVKVNGSVYRIIAQKLGKSVLVDAECTYGVDRGTIINLKKARSVIAGDIRKAINMGLVS